MSVVVFLGPSLPVEAARRVLPDATFLPPARQGDVWRALARTPRVIVLIDGVFDGVPSVWHREILAALDAGVKVLGASSMGALRAAELHGMGMQGVGEIFAGYRDGTLLDDADVALLHADAEHGFRPLTVPLVNVRHVARVARQRKVLTPAQARALVESASALHYQSRSWPAVLRPLDFARSSRWTRFVKRGLPDLKAEDALACLRAARRGLRGPLRRPTSPPPSSYLRRRRLVDGASGPGRPNGRILAALKRHPEVAAMTRAGLTRAVLAAYARALGLAAHPAQVKAAERTWLARVGVPPADRVAFFAANGMDGDEARRLCEDEVLAEAVLLNAPRLFPDGPAADEGLAGEARWRGVWAR